MSQDRPTEPTAAGQGSQGSEATRWSLIARATNKADPEDARLALGALFEIYAWPIYNYVRRRVAQVDEAMDLVQDFYLHVMEKDLLEKARRKNKEIGLRFRPFLYQSIAGFVQNRRRSHLALRRGGGFARLDIDWADVEARFGRQIAGTYDPEIHFGRDWGEALIRRGFWRVRALYEEEGRL